MVNQIMAEQQNGKLGEKTRAKCKKAQLQNNKLKKRPKCKNAN
jgi:hypothetical protein